MLSALTSRAPLIATVALSIAVTAQAANIALDLLSDVAVGTSTRSPTSHVRMDRGNGAMTLGAAGIARAHLFGAAAPESVAPSRAASRAPLVLTGIIATGDPKDGFAILGPSAATARVFHTGSQAAPGVTVADVYPQWVVVLRGGKRVMLKLPEANGGNQVINLRFERGSAPLDEVAGTGNDGVLPPSPDEFKPPPLSTANALMRAFSLRPVSVGGERGVRIMGTGINSGALSALGLAPGDVIKEINGVPVGSKDTPDFGKALSTGGITLMVERDGDETSVTIDAGAAATAANAYRRSAPEL